MMPQIDILLLPRWLIPIEPEGQVLTGQALAISAGRIVDILPAEKALQKYSVKEVVLLKNHAILPGLVNAHTHSPMSLMRGLADDLPLMTWLNEHIWPTENRLLNEEFVADGTRLACLEMLLSGTTTFQEHYLFPETIANTVAEVGMRSTIGLFMIKFRTAWANGVADCISKGRGLFEKYSNHPLIKINLAPHAPYSLDDDDLKANYDLAKKVGASLHMHVHETASEVEDSIREFNMRPLQRLEKLGLFELPFAAVHMTALNEKDFAILRKHPNISVVSCPESNLKLASGFCPTAKLLEHGVNVALGTDGAASNNDLDLFGEMRTAALIAKAESQNPTVLPAAQALKMATLNGAKALGLENKIGSLKVGKAADIIAVDLTTSCNTVPTFHPISHLVYALNSRQVTDVWVAGRRLVRNRVCTTLDEKTIVQHALNWGAKIGHK